LVIETGLLAVDVFFYLGGFFMGFAFMREKSKSWLKYPMAILQRVLRIWPSYILTMLFYYTTFMKLGSGPRWPFGDPIVKMCQNMWRSIFFVDNLIGNGKEQCMPWGWYLQVDFQIFLACLLVLGVFSYNRKAGLGLGGSMIIGSWTFNMIFTQQNNQKMFTDLNALITFNHYFLNVYIKPYARWTPYILGAFLGIAYS
jgi:peptidoglycan/LPS O-acetylase OafA/YrhL